MDIPAEDSVGSIGLEGIPPMDPGAPCPMVFAEDHALVLSYWCRDEPPYPPATAPLAVIRFDDPYYHSSGPPNDEAIAGHRLAGKGLHPCGVFRVEESSLIRQLEQMNTVHPRHDPEAFGRMVHYIFTFHDSTFECIAGGFTATVEQVGLGQEYDRTLACLRRREGQ